MPFSLRKSLCSLESKFCLNEVLVAFQTSNLLVVTKFGQSSSVGPVIVTVVLTNELGLPLAGTGGVPAKTAAAPVKWEVFSRFSCSHKKNRFSCNC